MKKAQRLFIQAAKAWEVGNNSGNSAVLTAKTQECEKLRTDAEKLLPAGVVVIYPGLYPCFQFQGRTFYDLKSLYAFLEEA